MDNFTILLAGGDRNATRSLQPILEESGYRVDVAFSGVEAMRLANKTSPALIMLDLELPDVSGFEVCSTIRERATVPIIVLGPKNERDIVRYLELGANDYIPKPWGIKELLARIRVALRDRINSTDSTSVFDDGYLRIEFLAHRIFAAKKEIWLTPSEYIILGELVKNPGVTIKYNELIKFFSKPGHKYSLPALFGHISDLHKKIEPNPKEPRYIINVTKQGYRYDLHRKRRILSLKQES